MRGKTALSELFRMLYGTAQNGIKKTQFLIRDIFRMADEPDRRFIEMTVDLLGYPKASYDEQNVCIGFFPVWPVLGLDFAAQCLQTTAERNAEMIVTPKGLIVHVIRGRVSDENLHQSGRFLIIQL